MVLNDRVLIAKQWGARRILQFKTKRERTKLTEKSAGNNKDVRNLRDYVRVLVRNSNRVELVEIPLPDVNMDFDSTVKHGAVSISIWFELKSATKSLVDKSVATPRQ